MSQRLLFPERESCTQERGALYIALEAEGFAVSQAQILTPHFMEWDERSWLLDLSFCLKYWRACAEGAGYATPIELLRRVLDESLQKADGNEARTYRAALAPHPWQAALLLGIMRARDLTGLVDVRDRFGQALYRQMDWSIWGQTGEVIASHFERAKTKHFQRDRFRQQSTQMRRAMQRLGFAGPFDLHDVDGQAIRRRFGSTHKLLWDWTGLESRSAASALEADGIFASGFPWFQHECEELPRRHRALDFPLLEWDHLAPLLQEDMNRLSRPDCLQPAERVVCLEWRLVLHDMTSLTIPIPFRHPHSLQHEFPQQRTALLQAYYNFTRVAAERFPSDMDSATTPMPPVVAWDLAITQKLAMPSQVLDVFGDRSTDQLALLQLENRLAVSLKSYDLNHSWVPESSYREATVPLLPRKAHSQNDAYVSLCALGRKRPLFLYQKPVALTPTGQSSLWQFLERTMDQWWRSSSKQRDYYRLIDGEHKSYWVFQDTPGQWYVHGIFA